MLPSPSVSDQVLLLLRKREMLDAGEELGFPQVNMKFFKLNPTETWIRKMMALGFCPWAFPLSILGRTTPLVSKHLRWLMHLNHRSEYVECIAENCAR